MNDAIKYLDKELEIYMRQIDTADENTGTISKLLRTIAIAKLSECVSKPNGDGERVFKIWESVTRTTLSGTGPK